MNLLLYILDTAITVYIWILIARVVLSWLISFNVINQFNQGVRAVDNFCRVLTEPLLRPIRRFMPDLGGLDISPIVLLLGIEFVRIFLFRALTGTL
jgi:YggT family protein